MLQDTPLSHHPGTGIFEVGLPLTVRSQQNLIHTLPSSASCSSFSTHQLKLLQPTSTTSGTRLQETRAKAPRGAPRLLRRRRLTFHFSFCLAGPSRLLPPFLLSTPWFVACAASSNFPPPGLSSHTFLSTPRLSSLTETHQSGLITLLALSA